MKDYELTILLKTDMVGTNPTITDEDREKVFDKVKAKVEEVGGKVNKIEPEGVKRLAYRIMNQEYADYNLMKIELPEYDSEIHTKSPATTLSYWLNIQEEVVRYLLVTVEPKRAK